MSKKGGGTAEQDQDHLKGASSAEHISEGHFSSHNTPILVASLQITSEHPQMSIKSKPALLHMSCMLYANVEPKFLGKTETL